jgi:hypothetical protein
MLLPVAGIDYQFIILILIFLCAEPDSNEHSGHYLFSPGLTLFIGCRNEVI